MFIHETSIIDDNVSIGKGSRIWHFCHIMSGSTMGENCSLGQNCMIGANVIIGNNLKAQNNVQIFEGVKIGDNVFLGPGVVFTNILRPRAFISQKHNFKQTLVKDGVSIGANATILCGITIGEYAFIGAGSVVTKDVPSFALVRGNPAKFIAWVDKAAQILHFDTNNIAYDSYDNSAYCLKNNALEVLNG